MDDLGHSSGRSASLGTNLGLLAALLFIVAAALLWHHIYRDPVALTDSRPDPDRLLMVRVEGPSRLSPEPLASPAGRQGSERDRAIDPTRTRPAPKIPIPPPPPQLRKYEVRKGDCLSTISGEIYGTATRWREIAEANEMAAPYVLKEGMILEIP